MSKPIPSDRELDLLKVMWSLGEAKVRDIHQALCPDGQCAFTTVQTLLRIMCKKGLVKKRSEGRTDFYTPVYTLENATSRFVDKVFEPFIRSDSVLDRYYEGIGLGLTLTKARDLEVAPRLRWTRADQGMTSNVYRGVRSPGNGLSYNETCLEAGYLGTELEINLFNKTYKGGVTRLRGFKQDTKAFENTVWGFTAET